MVDAVVWISGASSGIGRALAESVPWPGARVIGISRRPPGTGEHLAADLADPASWPVVGDSFRSVLSSFAGERVVFMHAAGSVEPLGFAADADPAAYTAGVLLNSASTQVLGQAFLAAAAAHPAPRRDLVMLSSGAARSVYPGWAAYGAAKAGMDQWVRNAGAEQDIRGGVQVLAVAPGVVDTAMQDRLRDAGEADFPHRPKFVELHETGRLSEPAEVAARIWRLVDAGVANGSVLDLRDLPVATR